MKKQKLREFSPSETDYGPDEPGDLFRKESDTSI